MVARLLTGTTVSWTSGTGTVVCSLYLHRNHVRSVSREIGSDQPLLSMQFWQSLNFCPTDVELVPSYCQFSHERSRIIVREL
jgi:hypothetical protein